MVWRADLTYWLAVSWLLACGLAGTQWLADLAQGLLVGCLAG